MHCSFFKTSQKFQIQLLHKFTRMTNYRLSVISCIALFASSPGSSKWSLALEQVPKEYTLHSFTDVSGRPKITFSNIGDGKFSGALVSESGQSSFDTLQIKKGLNVNGDTTARKLTVTTHIDSSTMDIKTKLNVARIDVSTAITTQELLAATMRVNGIVNITGDSSVNGQVTVGLLVSRGRVEARSMIASNDMKCQSMESTGLIKGKDIEAQNTLKVLGQLQSSDASFQGDVLVTKKIKMNEAEVKSLVVNGSMDIPGLLSCTGKLISKNLHTSGEVNMTGPVYMSDLKSKDIRVDGKAFATSLSTESLHASDVNIVGRVLMKNAHIEGDVMCNELQVKNNASFLLLNTAHAKVTKELMVEGKLSISGALVSRGDIVVNATISAQTVRVDDTLTAKTINIHGILKSGKLQSEGDIETRAAVIANNLYVKEKGVLTTVEAKSVNVSTTVECQQLQSEEVQASTISATNATIGSDLHVRGKMLCSAGIHTGTLDATTGTLSGNLT